MNDDGSTAPVVTSVKKTSACIYIKEEEWSCVRQWSFRAKKFNQTEKELLFVLQNPMIYDYLPVRQVKDYDTSSTSEHVILPCTAVS